MTQASEKIIDRIRKLLALGRNNPNEHEAEVAMRRAHKLLAEYNLSLSELTEKEKESNDPYTKEESIFKERFRPYGRTIANSIAKLYFCKMFYQRHDRFDIHTYVGRKTNVDIAKMVSEAVLATLCRQAKIESHGDAGFQTNFMDGASCRIHHRCMKMIAEAEAGTAKNDSGTANLPALRTTYLAEVDGANAYLETIGIRLKSGASRATGGRSGYDGRRAGDAAGSSVSLRPGLGINSTRAISRG